MSQIDDESKAGLELARALDHFYRKLAYSAPEQIAERLDELGAMISPAMAVFGFDGKDKT